MANDKNKTGLKVIIVGSGLAGLTAARILREHHDVTVYERGDISVATGGQGINITPNGVKILETIGYDRDRARAVPLDGFQVFDKEENLKQDFRVNLKAKFGGDVLSQMRADFREELMRLATAPPADLGLKKTSKPARIVYDVPVTALDAEAGTITLGDGSKITGDVVIVADGVHSRLRHTVLDNTDFAARETGLTCYRMAVSMDDAKKALRRDSLIPPWLGTATSDQLSTMISDTEGKRGFRMVVMYPVRNQTYLNISCIVRTQGAFKSPEDVWHVNGDRAKMIESFSDFSESFRAVIGAATELKVWELQDLESLPTWTRGRAILIGDAAHAMTPMQGQGANMAIEDADSLRLLTADLQRGDVPKMLKQIESFRKPRTVEVLARTRQSQSEVKAGSTLIANLQFVYGYNGIHEAMKAH